MADTHRLISCEAGMPVQMPPPGSSRSSCSSDPRNLLVSSEHAVLAVEFFLHALDTRATFGIFVHYCSGEYIR